MTFNFFKWTNSPNLKSLLLKFPSWNYEIVKIKNPKVHIFGLTSKTQDNKHILCLDYDLVDKNVVLMDIFMLKNMIKPMPSLAFLFTTFEEEDSKLGIIRGNYHVIFLDKFFFRECEEIMSLTHSDKIHRILANRSVYRSWVLRLSQKGDRNAPKLLQVWQFANKKQKRECSYAHYLLLKSIYKFEINEKNINWDKYTQTTITFYNTASKLDLGVKKNG